MQIGAAARPNAALSVEVAEQIGITAHGIRRAWQNYRAYRATRAELEALSDRELSDLGIDRTAIKAIAHRAVHGA